MINSLHSDLWPGPSPSGFTSVPPFTNLIFYEFRFARM
jgi:hypothetical protein